MKLNVCVNNDNKITELLRFNQNFVISVYFFSNSSFDIY